MTDEAQPAGEARKPGTRRRWVTIAPALAGVAALLLLVMFPIYHRLGVPRDVLRWGSVTAWGPGTTAWSGDDGPVLGFGEAERVDQGVTFLLQHSETRRLELEGLTHLRVDAACRPAPCTLEVRVLAAPDDEGPGSWPWLVFGERPTEQNLPLGQLGAELRRQTPAAVLLVRTEDVRKRDGAPRARQVDVHRLEFW